MISNPTSREEITLPRLFIKRLKPSQIRSKRLMCFCPPKKGNHPKTEITEIWLEISSRFGRAIEMVMEYGVRGRRGSGEERMPAPPSTSARISRRHKRKTVQAGPAVINLQAKQGSSPSYSSTLTLSLDRLSLAYLFLSTPVE